VLIKRGKAKFGFLLKTETSKTVWDQVISPIIFLIIGSFANITSAAAVAASSFEMIVTDPKPFLENLDPKMYNFMRAFPVERGELAFPKFSNPIPLEHSSTTESFKLPPESHGLPKLIEGRIQRFGDNVDTDQVCFFQCTK
jgi:homoaconitate hydratase